MLDNKTLFITTLSIFFPLTEFAMSPNSNEVHIYSKKGPKWEVETVLKNVSALFFVTLM